MSFFEHGDESLSSIKSLASQLIGLTNTKTFVT